MKCKFLLTGELDFPHVTLNVKEATVTFRNPLHFYSELKQADKPDDASFKFYVSSKHVSTNKAKRFYHSMHLEDGCV